MFYLFIRLVGRYPQLVTRFVTRVREPGLLSTTFVLLAVAVILVLKTGRQHIRPGSLLLGAGFAALIPVLMTISGFLFRHRAWADVPGRGIWLSWVSRLALDVLVALALFALLLKASIFPETSDPRERVLLTTLIAGFGAGFLLRTALITVGSAGSWNRTIGLLPIVAQLDRGIEARVQKGQYLWLQYLATLELSSIPIQTIANVVREELQRIPVPLGRVDGALETVVDDPSLDDSSKRVRLLALLLHHAGPRFVEDVVTRLRDEPSDR